MTKEQTRADDTPAHVLLVLCGSVPSPELVGAACERAARGACWFHVLIPCPRVTTPRPLSRADMLLVRDAVEQVEAAAHRPADGSMSVRHDQMAAVEDALFRGDFDEVILERGPPSRIARRLHLDRPRRTDWLGVPVTVIEYH